MPGRVVAAVELGGLAAAAELVAPEAFREAVKALVMAARGPLVDEGAAVDSSAGHTLIATWADDDQAGVAVRAALAILDGIKRVSDDLEGRYGVRFWVRVGLDVSSEPPLPAVQRARAVSALGRPDGIIASRSVRRLVRHQVRMVTLAPIAVMPGEAPERVYEVVGAKVAKAAADRAPFVGRQAESRQLVAVMKETHQNGPQIVDLVGDAGMGKSRLALEFAARVSQRGLGRVIPSVAGVDQDDPTHNLVPSLVRNWLGISGMTLPEEVVDRLQTELTRLKVSAPARKTALLGHLLDIEIPIPDVLSLSPFQMRVAAHRALDEVLLAMAGEAFLLIVMEDLQWADETSLGWFHGLLQSLEERPDLPLMVLACFRTEADRDFGEGFGPMRTRMHLEGLAKWEGRRLAAGLLGMDSGLEAIPEAPVRNLIDQAIDRAAGNPMHLSEILQALIDQGALLKDRTGWHRGTPLAGLPLPASLREATAERLDQLDDVLRKTVQAAAVLGRSFAPSLLARLLDVEHLQGLLAELVLSDLIMAGDSGDYSFIQPVVQEVAYHAIPEAERRQWHRKAALALEQFQTPSRQHNPLPVARHFLLSDEPALAVPYLVGAGERALAANSPADSLLHFSKALDLLDVRPQDVPRSRILRGLAEAQAMDGRYMEAIAHLETLLAEPGETDIMLVDRLADLYARAGDPAAARATRQRALAGLQPEASGLARAGLQLGLAELNLSEGLATEAETQAREALLLANELQEPGLISRALLVLGRCAVHQGELETGIEAFRNVALLQDRLSNLPALAAALTELGHHLRVQGEWLEAGKALNQAFDAAEAIGESKAAALAELALGELQLDQGEPDAALGLMMRAHDRFLIAGDLPRMGLARLRIGEATLACHDAVAITGGIPAEQYLEEAERFVDDGLAIAHALSDEALRVSLYRLAAEVVARRGRSPKAHLEAAEQMADATGSSALREEVYRAIAELALFSKDLTRAKNYARRASQLADEKARPLSAGRTFAALARIHVACGDTDTGDDMDARAFGIFNRLGAKRDLAALDR